MLRLDTAPLGGLLALSRARQSEAYVQQKVSLPAVLVARFGMLHWDPVLQKPKYGAISDILTRLLTDYVNQMEHGVNPFAADPAAQEPPLEPSLGNL